MAALADTYGPLLGAASFAARAHHGQMRKDDKTPYVSHVFRVCLVIRDIFGFDDPRMLITALLHDTIEDTTKDFDDVEKDYGQEIARWVAFLTKNKAARAQNKGKIQIPGVGEAEFTQDVAYIREIA